MNINDCPKCALRLDGTQNKTFCFHETFDHIGTSGKQIPLYPSTPEWCPGMLPDDEATWEPLLPKVTP